MENGLSVEIMPTVSERKSYARGSAAHVPESPKPLREAVSVAALLVTVRVPAAAPAVVGEKVTRTLAVSPGDSVPGRKVERTWNAGLFDPMDVTTRLFVPVLVTEKMAGALF